LAERAEGVSNGNQACDEAVGCVEDMLDDETKTTMIDDHIYDIFGKVVEGHNYKEIIKGVFTK
jgi:hypothetical protein